MTLPTSILNMTLNHLMARLQPRMFGSTPLFLLFPGPLWLGGVPPDRALSIGQIEQTMCANKWLMLIFGLLYSNTWNHLTVCKKKTLVNLRMSSKNVFINYIYLIYVYKQDLALNNLQWLICHKTQPNLLTDGMRFLEAIEILGYLV